VEVGRPAPAKSTFVYRTEVRGKVTVAAYSATFLAQHEYSDAGRTFAEHVIRNYIKPQFGSCALASVTRADIRAWFPLLGRIKSGGDDPQDSRVGSSMWRDAMEEDLVTDNPWLGHRIKRDAAKATRHHDARRLPPHS
jgi:hypothetical protein